MEICPVDVKASVESLLKEGNHPSLWLIVQDNYPEGHLVGVLSPFELM